MKSSELVSQLTGDIIKWLKNKDVSKHELEVFIIQWLLDNDSTIAQLKKTFIITEQPFCGKSI